MTTYPTKTFAKMDLAREFADFLGRLAEKIETNELTPDQVKALFETMDEAFDKTYDIVSKAAIIRDEKLGRWEAEYPTMREING